MPGAPVNGAAVSVNCAGCVTKTNQAGEFTFANLKPGSYVVAISKAGYYREFLPHYGVFKNLDWTYAPIEIERCPAEGCERTPQQAKIIPACGYSYGCFRRTIGLRAAVTSLTFAVLVVWGAVLTRSSGLFITELFSDLLARYRVRVLK